MSFAIQHTTQLGHKDNKMARNTGREGPTHDNMTTYRMEPHPNTSIGVRGGFAPPGHQPGGQVKGKKGKIEAKKLKFRQKFEFPA